MISSILLSFASVFAPTSSLPVFTPQEENQEAQEDEVAQKIAACGEDATKLMELAAAFKEADEGEAARLVYRRVLEVDSEHEAAHKALRHHNYDGKWFESYAQLSKYRREEAKRMKEEFGLVRYNDEWVPEVDLPYLRMGWEKDGETWVNPHKLARKKEAEEKTAEGWQQQDLTWVSPDEFDQWREGLWKVGEEWVTSEEANTHHAKLGQWWTVPGEKFIAYSTNDRDTVQWIVWYADNAYADLVRIFGEEPLEKPLFFCLSSIDQYNEFAAGSQANQLPPSEIDGFSSLHYAYFAESFFDVNVTPPEYKGGGSAYWDRTDPNLDAFGRHSIRHAAGQSYCEAIDPSWNAVSQIISNAGGGQASTDAFWAEKRIPRWLRYGGACYVERYFEDKTVDGNTWAFREWALSNIRETGLDELDKIFGFTLDLNDIPGSTHMILEAGAVVSFMIDGDCKPVQDAHVAFKAAMKSGEDTSAAGTALEEAIRANEDQLFAYTNMSRKLPPVVPPATPTADHMGTDGEAGAEEQDAAKTDGDGETEKGAEGQ